MARGLEVLHAAIDEGRWVRCIHFLNGDWGQYDETAREFIFEDDSGRYVHEIPLSALMREDWDWEIEGGKNILRPDDVIKMLDQGEIVEQRDSVAERGWTKWRVRDGHYEREGVPGDWYRSSLTYRDLHDATWQVAPKRRAAEKRPTLEEIDAWVSMHYSPGAPWDAVFELLARRWPQWFPPYE